MARNRRKLTGHADTRARRGAATTRTGVAADRRGTERRRLLAVLTAALLLAAACGGGGGGGGTAEGGSASSDGGEPDPNGVIRMGYDLASAAKGPFVWDPVEQATSVTDNGILALVYGTLLREAADSELVPDLAASTEVVDGQTVEVTLRDGLTFSDGAPFDAEAVKAGLERNLAEGDPAAFGDAFFELTAVEAVTPTTVRLTIADGTAASWHDSYLASWETSIVSPGTTDFTRPAGAGPMTVASFEPEQRVVLEKNPDYWDAGSVLVGGVELVHISAESETAAAAALAAGQVDMATIPPTQIPALGPDADVLLEVDPNALMSLMLCKRDGPLADPQVRQALNKAVDRQLLSDAVFQGAYQPAHGLWPEGHRFHDPAVEDAVSYDPDGARALLEDAGYADGFEFDIYFIGATNMPEVVEVVQQMFADVGVTANLVPSANYVADFLGAQKPGAGAVPTMSPNRLKLQQWTGDSLGNTCHYEDPGLLDLRAQLNQVSDSSATAVDAWHAIEQTVVADDTLSVFLLFGASPIAYDTGRIGDAAATPDTLAVPDVRRAFVRAGS